MTYVSTGVDYGAMDPFKRMAQLIAQDTAKNISEYSGDPFRELKESRGESAYLIDAGDFLLAHVEEGLGTKNLVADAMGGLHYGNIAQCTVAMIVNDMVTLGAMPLSVAMHLAVGDSSWFDDRGRVSGLLIGWKRACNMARCAWGGGETPTLKDIVLPGAAVLSGSAMGIVNPKERLIRPDKIRRGDVIMIIESSGIHANGLTLARRIADKLPEKYNTKLSDGRTYGETLLDPTHIYVGLVQDCLDAGVEIHYAVNITGHGWRKLMRPVQPWSYVINSLPRQLPIFDFLQKHGPVDDEEAYGNLNMGAGFALYVPSHDAHDVIAVAQNLGLVALVAGYIEKGEKRVVIQPKNLEYKGQTLAVR